MANMLIILGIVTYATKECFIRHISRTFQMVIPRVRIPIHHFVGNRSYHIVWFIWNKTLLWKPLGCDPERLAFWYLELLGWRLCLAGILYPGFGSWLRLHAYGRLRLQLTDRVGMHGRNRSLLLNDVSFWWYYCRSPALPLLFLSSPRHALTILGIDTNLRCLLGSLFGRCRMTPEVRPEK